MELDSQGEKWEQAKSIAIHRLPPCVSPPQKKKEREKDEWNSFINKQEMKKKAQLAEKQAKKQRGQKKRSARREMERVGGWRGVHVVSSWK